MNANELADVLMSTKFQVDEDGTMIGVSHQAVNEAVTMLRQQQAEIENLKAGLLSHYDIDPVKELTDEEIKEVIRKHWNREYKNKSMLEFARAILRKAQDK